jgi:hypothetical protein
MTIGRPMTADRAPGLASPPGMIRATMTVAEPDSSEQTVARRQALGQLGKPVRRFMRTEAGSAGLLLAATLLALAWANLWAHGYGQKRALRGGRLDGLRGQLRGRVHFGARVLDDALGVEASGVRGTPTFFVGGRRHTGPTDAATLGRALDSAAAGVQR